MEPNEQSRAGSPAALPIEYRYQTGLAACLFGGLGGLALLLFAGRGTGALLLAAPLCGLVLYGLAALLADPSGFVNSMGKKLIVTDYVIEEVDEFANVRWQLRCGELAGVRTVLHRPVLPGISDRWSAEALELLTGDGRSFRIPVWLLPRRGIAFRYRLEDFIARGRGEGTAVALT